MSKAFKTEVKCGEGSRCVEIYHNRFFTLLCVFGEAVRNVFQESMPNACLAKANAVLEFLSKSSKLTLRGAKWGPIWSQNVALGDLGRVFGGRRGGLGGMFGAFSVYVT